MTFLRGLAWPADALGVTVIEAEYRQNRCRFHLRYSVQGRIYIEAAPWEELGFQRLLRWKRLIARNQWVELPLDRIVQFLDPEVAVGYLRPPNLAWPPERHFN